MVVIWGDLYMWLGDTYTDDSLLSENSLLCYKFHEKKRMIEL